MSEIYPVKSNLANSAHIDKVGYHDLYGQSVQEPASFWLKQSERIDWIKKPTVAMSGDFNEVNFKWFEDGSLNVAHNCIDRHLVKKANDIAIIWAKDEPGEYENITYQQLHDRVNQYANLYKKLGIKKGDRVCLYLPMVPDLAYATLACARIGAIHSIVFAGFSAEALRGRIEDAKCEFVLTANEGIRGGKKIPLKDITDKAVEGLAYVKNVLVYKRTEKKTNWQDGRDLWLHDELASMSTKCESAEMNAEDPLFILYTSGSTGKPKGLQHSTGGYITYASMTHQYVFDYQPGDVYFCAADIGWITGHSYIIYGPLANGATTVMFESTPTYPDASRYWQIVEDLKVNIFYTAPTALRAIAQFGNEPVHKHDRKSLKVLGSVGEPINPEVWKWYHDIVGENRCAIVDTWWQTETGGIMITPLPGATTTKPGSATLPFFGIRPVLVNAESGEELLEKSTEGALCIAHSWPGQARTIYGDHTRFIDTYFTQYKGYYFTGDGCRRDDDGYHWITGRIDDVLNVSGHRLGTAEIESALMENESVAEAAVVGYPHDIKGTGIYCYVILYPNAADQSAAELIETLKDEVRDKIGRFAAPDKLHITAGLPKTRSGKVMRRILRKIAAGEADQIGDISTLADPNVVEKLITENKNL